MLKPVLISSVLLPLSAFGIGEVPAHAETVSQKVSYSDLDLTSETGRARLDRRIKWAIRDVCGSRDLASDPRHYRQVRACERDAFAGTRPQVTKAIAQAEGTQQLASR